jgi:hypothetical protein
MEHEDGSVGTTMLMVLNLYVIDKILTESSEVKLSASAQMVYLNCLMHHFKHKEANVSNIIAFELFEDDFGDYGKYKKQLQELHKARLITIGVKTIVFHNVWGKYIDRDKLNKVSPEKYVAGFKFQSVTVFKDELLQSRQLFELAQMKYKLSKMQSQKLIELFVVEQEAFQKKYINFSDCIKHCTYWIGMNCDRIPKESVKSNGKILGG